MPARPRLAAAALAVLLLPCGLSGCASHQPTWATWMQGYNSDKEWLLFLDGSLAVVPLEGVKSVTFEADEEEPDRFRLVWSGGESTVQVNLRHRGDDEWSYEYQALVDGQWTAEENRFYVRGAEPLALALRSDGGLVVSLQFETWHAAPGSGPALDLPGGEQVTTRGFPYGE